MKKMIHIDADCFYASVEMCENPNLRSLPIAVGGKPNKRGVIATCNYHARNFGIRSAMSSAYAKKLCPSLHIISPRIPLYKDYSDAMRDIFYEYTDRVEPLSLDEAYLDVSDKSFFRGSATLIAEEIRWRIYQKLGITVSAGVAPSKYLAKIASDWNKPNNIFVVSPDMVNQFLFGLHVSKLPGVGPVTAKKLSFYGMSTCADVRNYGLKSLIKHFGKFGVNLYRMSCGTYHSDIAVKPTRKSISTERTFENDLDDCAELNLHFKRLIVRLQDRFNNLRTHSTAQKCFVKVKFSDFSIFTLQSDIELTHEDIYPKFFALFNQVRARKQLPLRLIGVGYRLDGSEGRQLSLSL